MNPRYCVPIFLKIAVLSLLLVARADGSRARPTPSDTTGTGIISGAVVDARTGEAIIGANVLLVGTNRGDATDIDGEYTIAGVRPGVHSLRFSYISHHKKTVSEIEVRPGEVTNVTVSLQPQTRDMGEITVTADANRSSEAGLLALQKKASAVQDGLSSERLERSGAGNVAEAMKQVSGVSLVDGRDVYVRGLGNRYSNVQLDGAPVPSSNPNEKEAPVDLFGSGIVDNIVVQKTYTPDQAGEFSGGSVQIVTREFPSDRSMEFAWSAGYNSLTTMKDYLSYDGSPTDFLGYDNGHRGLPGELKDGRITGRGEAAAVRDKLHGTWIPDRANALPSQKISLGYADRFNEDRMPVGVVSSFRYSYENQSRPGETYRYIQNFNPSSGKTNLGADYTVESGIRKTHLGGMVNLFVKPTPHSKIGLKNLYSNSSTDEARVIQGDYYNYRGRNRQTVLDFERRSVYSSTLSYESYFPRAAESELEVSLGWSGAGRTVPDRRNVQYSENDDGLFELMLADRGNVHFFSYQNDRNLTGRVDYRFKPLSDLTIKAGGMALWKNRDFDAYRLLYRDLNNRLTTQQRLLGPERLFTSRYVSGGEVDLVENTQPYDSYTGGQQIFAGYLSGNWRPAGDLSLEGGVRVERSTQAVNSRTLIDRMDLLPALNTTYRLGPDANLRGAFSITLARPEFRELSNFNFRDFIGGRTVYGNPELQRTRIHNYDLRVEVYPRSGELAAASLFYKRFENPIEMAYRITQNNEVNYVNVAGADLYGLELELRKNIAEGLRLSTSLSLIHSSVSYGDRQALARQANAERPMYGQSPYTFNAVATYVVPGIGLESHLSFHTFGPRISAVGNAQQPDDEYEQPFHQLDLHLSRRFGAARLSLGIENLLGDHVRHTQGQVTTVRHEVGRTVSVGISLAY